MNDKLIELLQSWYASQCDGEWEELFGVTIDTLDNPGWKVSIDLNETEWEELVVEMHCVERSDEDWFQFEVRDRKFIGAGDPSKLGMILSAFFRLVGRLS